MGFSKFFAKAAASLSAPSSSDKASIYLHTLKVECPVASEGSFLREAIQQVLVKMTTADATIRFVTVTDKAVDPNDLPTNKSAFNDMFNVKSTGTRRKATISAFFKAHSAKPLYELKKELWNFLGPLKHTVTASAGTWTSRTGIRTWTPAGRRFRTNRNYNNRKPRTLTRSRRPNLRTYLR